MRLTDFFERAVIISRRDRPERRARREKHLAEVGVDEGVEWFPAVVGDLSTAPEGWDVGAGAWGCLQSHLTVLDRARHDRVASILVLEDDVLFTPYLGEALPRFMEAVPPRWHQVYLGGQHLAYPEPTDHPLVFRGRNINRTHAYAVAAEALPVIGNRLRHFERYRRERSFHIDWQLGASHEGIRWETFCPTWWLAGQDECVSDVWDDHALPARWWHLPRHAQRLPFVVCPDRSSVPADSASVLLFADDPELPEEHQARFQAARRSEAVLRSWLRNHAVQALTYGRLPAWIGDASRIRTLWPAGVRLATKIDLKKAAEYPFNRLFPHPFISNGTL